MTTIDVHASGSYTVTVGSGLLPRCGEYAASLARGRRVMLVSDANVFPLHGETVCKSLARAGFTVETFVMPAG